MPEGTWNAWVIKQKRRTSHRLNERRSADGTRSPFADQLGSRIQMLRKSRMCKRHSIGIIRGLLPSPLGTFKYFGVSDTLKMAQNQRLILETLTRWAGQEGGDVLSTEWFRALVTRFKGRKTKELGTLRQLWAAFLLCLGWHPGTALAVCQLLPTHVFCNWRQTTIDS